MDKSILLVDGDIDLLNSLKELLRSHGYFVLEHSDPRQALESFCLDDGLNFLPPNTEMPGTDNARWVKGNCPEDVDWLEEVAFDEVKELLDGKDTNGMGNC
jgi:hypothetical protein